MGWGRHTWTKNPDGFNPFTTEAIWGTGGWGREGAAPALPARSDGRPALGRAEGTVGTCTFTLFNGWVIFHCIYVPHLLYPFLCWWTFRLLPCLGYCKQCCSEHWGACILSFTRGVCCRLVLPRLLGCRGRAGVSTEWEAGQWFFSPAVNWYECTVHNRYSWSHMNSTVSKPVVVGGMVAPKMGFALYIFLYYCCIFKFGSNMLLDSVC